MSSLGVEVVAWQDQCPVRSGHPRPNPLSGCPVEFGFVPRFGAQEDRERIAFRDEGIQRTGQRIGHLRVAIETEVLVADADTNQRLGCSNPQVVQPPAHPGVVGSIDEPGEVGGNRDPVLRNAGADQPVGVALASDAPATHPGDHLVAQNRLRLGVPQLLDSAAYKGERQLAAVGAAKQRNQVAQRPVAEHIHDGSSTDDRLGGST